jgi:hypothetical protein
MGIDSENLPAEPLGFRWLAKPVSSKSVPDHALNDRGWPLPRHTAVLSSRILIAFHRYQSTHSDTDDRVAEMLHRHRARNFEP